MLFRSRFGEQRLINDPMEASYLAFNLWAKAVKHARSINPNRVKEVIGLVSFNGPEGIVAVDDESLHLWKTVRIGQAKKDGQFKIVWQSDRLVKPAPYPSYQSRKTWEKLVDNLFADGMNHE